MTLAPSHDAAVAAALTGSGLDTFTARCVLEFDAGAMLERRSANERRFQNIAIERGRVVSERARRVARDATRETRRTGGADGGGGSNDANDARERRKPRIRVRARLAEGLDLRIPRRSGGGSDREEDAGDQRVANVGHTVGHIVGHTVGLSGCFVVRRLLVSAAKGYAWFASGSSSSCGGRETPAQRARLPPGRRCVPRGRFRWERRSCRRSELRPRRLSFARRGMTTTRRRRRRRAAVPHRWRTRPRRTLPRRPIGGRRWRPPSASTASTATPGRGSGRTPASAPSRSGARAPRPDTSPSATSSRPITIRRIRPKSRAFGRSRARVRASPGAAVDHGGRRG